MSDKWKLINQESDACGVEPYAATHISLVNSRNGKYVVSVSFPKQATAADTVEALRAAIQVIRRAVRTSVPPAPITPITVQ